MSKTNKKKHHKFNYHKKIIIEHYCRKCGKPYVRRYAKAFKFEPKVIQYSAHCCKDCAESLADIAPVFRQMASIYNYYKVGLNEKI